MKYGRSLWALAPLFVTTEIMYDIFVHKFLSASILACKSSRSLPPWAGAPAMGAPFGCMGMPMATLGSAGLPPAFSLGL